MTPELSQMNTAHELWMLHAYSRRSVSYDQIQACFTSNLFAFILENRTFCDCTSSSFGKLMLRKDITIETTRRLRSYVTRFMSI